MEKSIKKLVIRLIFGKSGRTPYQLSRNNIDQKAKLIKPLMQEMKCESFLDVGCNAGVLSRELSNNYFSVGIDQKLDLRGVKQPLKDVVLGEIKVNRENLKKMPVFDSVCLFGVHHQWHKNNSPEECEELVKAVAEKASKVFFIQFASINEKYLKEGEKELFIDNNEESVKEYAESWLKKNFPEKKRKYLGKIPETRIENFRYIYAVLNTI